MIHSRSPVCQSLPLYALPKKAVHENKNNIKDWTNQLRQTANFLDFSL
jgi:hypothetical protein